MMLRRALPLIVLLLAALAAFFWWQNRTSDALPPGVARGNGRIEMTRTDIATKYAGRLARVGVAEGDSVAAGQIVAALDPADIEAQLQGAHAARARALAALAQAEGEQAAQASQAALAGVTLRETSRLAAQAMVSNVELEQRRLAREAAGGAVAAARGGVLQARAAIAQAEAQIAQLTIARSDLDIRAPVAGRVEYRIVEPGTVLPAGGKIVSLLDPLDVTLTLFLPADTVARLRLGDEARIVPQGMAKAIPARIVFIAPDAQFTPKFVETQSEREKLSYRVKLRIPADVARGLNGQLKAGMTADGYVRTDPHQAWPVLPLGAR